MDEKTKQQMPIKIMEEICRFSAKLQELGVTKTPITMAEDVNVVSDTVVFTPKLMFGKTVLAEYKIIDPRPVAEVTAEAESKKQEIQQNADVMKTQLDKVLDACKPKK